MRFTEDVNQLKGLLADAHKLKDNYAHVLELRTKERDELQKRLMRLEPHDAVNVVQLTPEIILRERKEAANSIIKVAMRRISKQIGMVGPIRKILTELIDEDKGTGNK